MPSETYTQVAPNSTGSKIRNIQFTTIADDGTQNVVQMQVLSIADAVTGRPIDMDIANRMDELIAVQSQIRQLLQLICEEVCQTTLDTGEVPADESLHT